MEIKFGIITPTILRPTLWRTCDFINQQTYSNWHHIVMCDKQPITDEEKQLLERIQHPQRTISFCETPHGKDYIGNPCRYNSFDLLDPTVTYITYIDDDDHFDKECFDNVQRGIEQNNYPDAVVWPAWRFGAKFFAIPPQICHTVTGQYAYKKNPSNGKEYRWPTTAGYLEDGLFVNKLEEELHFVPICADKPLTIIDQSNHGN